MKLNREKSLTFLAAGSMGGAVATATNMLTTAMMPDANIKVIWGITLGVGAVCTFVGCKFLRFLATPEKTDNVKEQERQKVYKKTK